MSKIVDLLTYKKRSADKKGYEDIFHSKVLSENFDTDTKEKIASTYIFNPVGNKENLKKVIGGDSHLSPLKAAHPGAKIFNLFPWLISLLAIALLLVNIAYRGKINIKIEIVGNNTDRINSENAKAVAAQKNMLSGAASHKMDSDSNRLIANGQANTVLVKKIGFYGAALRDSKILKDGIYLVNDGTAAWASAGFDMAQSTDLTDSSLEFFAKGLTGNESLELILRDSNHNSYLPQARSLIFDKNMSGEWQFVSIPFGNFDGYYNSKIISHIGFEFGTQTTSNDPGASIYIRDIKIVKR